MGLELCVGGGARVEQPGPLAGTGRVRPRGGAREGVGVGRRVGGRGGGGIKVDGEGDGAVLAPFGVEMVGGVGSGAERANAGTGLVTVTAEALGVACPSSADSELDRPRLVSGSGAVCWITGGGGIGL